MLVVAAGLGSAFVASVPLGAISDALGRVGRSHCESGEVTSNPRHGLLNRRSVDDFEPPNWGRGSGDGHLGVSGDGPRDKGVPGLSVVDTLFAEAGLVRGLGTCADRHPADAYRYPRLPARAEVAGAAASGRLAPNLSQCGDGVMARQVAIVPMSLRFANRHLHAIAATAANLAVYWPRP